MPTFAPLLGEPAPVELMNTVWAARGEVHDALATDPELAGWLHDALHLDEQPTAAQAGRVRRLRTALRTLAAAATGDDRPAAVEADPDLDHAVAVVNETAARAPAWPQLVWADRPRAELRTARPGVEAELSALAEQAVRLFAADDHGGLRACRAPGCVLYFVHDHPRREWCSPGCGNRARAARHYDRHRRSGRPAG